MHFRVRVHQDGHLLKTDRRSRGRTVSGGVWPGGPGKVCTERTYCSTAVGDQAGRLLEGLVQVVLEAFVLVLLGAHLHELPWEGRAVDG